MGLFDRIKEKVNEVHVCAFCNRETSGVFSSVRLKNGEHICMDCFPKETKLMKEKDVCDGFSLYGLDYNGLNAYFEYRKKEQAYREAFSIDEIWLDGNLFVDQEHGYFKLKGYEEVFEIQQIEIIRLAY